MQWDIHSIYMAILLGFFFDTNVKKICKTSSAKINVKRLRRSKNIQVPSHHFSGDPKGNRRGFSLHDSQSKASVYTSL